MSFAIGERSVAGRRRAIARSPLAIKKRGFGAVGKWETCCWFSTFPSALVVGAVGMWESRRLLARFPRGSWKEWEACFWLSTLSTAPAFPQLILAWVCRAAVLSGREWNLSGTYRCAISITIVESGAASDRELGLEFFALVTNFQLELPALEAHQHSTQLLP